MNISCFLSSFMTTNWISLGREQKRDIWGTFSDVFINQTTTKIVEKVLRLIVNETIILHFDWNCVFVLRQQRFKTCRKFQVWWTEVFKQTSERITSLSFYRKEENTFRSSLFECIFSFWAWKVSEHSAVIYFSCSSFFSSLPQRQLLSF